MGSTSDFIDLLGGSNAVAGMLSAAGYPAQRNAVGNWRKRGFFPPESYLVFQKILSKPSVAKKIRKERLRVDPALWRLAIPLKNGKG